MHHSANPNAQWMLIPIRGHSTFISNVIYNGSPQCPSLRIEHCLFGGQSSSMSNWHRSELMCLSLRIEHCLFGGLSSSCLIDTEVNWRGHSCVQKLGISIIKFERFHPGQTLQKTQMKLSTKILRKPIGQDELRTVSVFWQSGTRKIQADFWIRITGIEWALR